jgi:hypothetical protein
MMKFSGRLAWMLVGVICLAMTGAEHAAGDQEQKPAVSPAMPVYKPPPRGAPAGLVAGATRGARTKSVAQVAAPIAVIAPDHVGLTTQEQPALYFYLTKPTDYPLEVTIAEEGSVGPLFETRVAPPIQAGLQWLRLSDVGIRLSEQRQYRWLVALIPDPASRNTDIVAGGAIERVGVGHELRAKLAQRGKEGASHVYAEAGIWYDSVCALMNQIGEKPTDPTPRKGLAALLQQVGLTQIAEQDMSPGASIKP